MKFSEGVVGARGSGLRVAAGLAVIGAIVGEFVAGTLDENGGLGIQVVAFNRNLQTDVVFASVVLASGLTYADAHHHSGQ